MSQPNVVKQDGVTLFMNTVVGIFDDTQHVITVGSLTVDWKETRAQYEQRIAEITDALSVVISEAQEDGVVAGSNMARAIESALLVVQGVVYAPTPEPEPSLDVQEFSPQPSTEVHNRRKSDRPSGAYLDGLDARNASAEELTVFDSEQDKTDYQDGYRGFPYKHSHKPAGRETGSEAAVRIGRKAGREDRLRVASADEPRKANPYPLNSSLAHLWNDGYAAGWAENPF